MAFAPSCWLIADVDQGSVVTWPWANCGCLWHVECLIEGIEDGVDLRRSTTTEEIRYVGKGDRVR